MQKVKSKPAEKDAYRYIAPIYAWLEKLVFRQILSRSRSFGLDVIQGGAKVLILGGGSGEVLNYLPNCEIDYVESSESMIIRASKKVGDRIVHFQQVPFSKFRSSTAYDHIICQYFLDLFEEEEFNELLEHLDHLSADHTLLHVADFRINNRESGKWWQRGLVKLMYSFFRITTGLKTGDLPAIEHILKRANYVEKEGQSWMKGLVFASVWSRSSTSSDL